MADELIRLVTQVVGSQEVERLSKDMDDARQKMAALGVTMQDIANNTPKYQQALVQAQRIMTAQAGITQSIQQTGSVLQRMSSNPIFLTSLAAGIEDVQFGLSAVINNVQMFSYQFAQIMGWGPLAAAKFAAALQITAVATNVLIQKGGEWFKTWMEGDKVLTLIEQMDQALEKLNKKNVKTFADRQEISRLKEEKRNIERSEETSKSIVHGQTGTEQEVTGAAKSRLRDRAQAQLQAIEDEAKAHASGVARAQAAADRKTLEEKIKAEVAARSTDPQASAANIIQDARHKEQRAALEKKVGMDEANAVAKAVRDALGDVTNLDTATDAKLAQSFDKIADKLAQKGNIAEAIEARRSAYQLRQDPAELERYDRMQGMMAGGDPEAMIAGDRQRLAELWTKAQDEIKVGGEVSAQTNRAMQEAFALTAERLPILRQMKESLNSAEDIVGKDTILQEQLHNVWQDYLAKAKAFADNSDARQQAILEAQQKQEEAIQASIEKEGEDRGRKLKRRLIQKQIQEERARENAIGSGTAGAIEAQVAFDLRGKAPKTEEERAALSRELQQKYPGLTDPTARQLIDRVAQQEALKPAQEQAARRAADIEQDTQNYMQPARSGRNGLGRVMERRARRGESLDTIQADLIRQMRANNPNMAPEAAENVVKQTRAQYEEYENRMAAARDTFGPLADPRVRLRAAQAGEFGRGGIAAAQMATDGGIMGRAARQFRERQEQAQEAFREAQWKRFGKYADPQVDPAEQKAKGKNPMEVAAAGVEETSKANRNLETLNQNLAEVIRNGIPIMVG